MGSVVFVGQNLEAVCISSIIFRAILPFKLPLKTHIWVRLNIEAHLCMEGLTSG